SLRDFMLSLRGFAPSLAERGAGGRGFLVICLFALIFFGCNGADAPPPKIIDTYILSAEVKNKPTGEITIDNKLRTIVIEMVTTETKNDVVVSLELADGVSMVSPANKEAEYNLESEATIILLASGRERTFKMRVKDLPAIDPTSKGWTVTTSFGDLPDGITVFESPAQLQGKNAVAYLAMASTRTGTRFHVLGEASGYNTPTQFYTKTGNIYPIIINAGYFWDGANLSLICRDGEIVAPNNQTVTRSNGSANVQFYPTRGVFSLTDDGEYRTDWVFTTVTPGTTFAYPEPAPNKSGSPPMPIPSEQYPAGAWEYKAQTAIGGGPVLIKNGVYRNTWEAELYDAPSGIGHDANHPRTAIGITADGMLMLFVCEGRNMTPDTPGFTLADVAQIMTDLGCVELLNLDGGGSTCMLVNGKETIKPSDGNQRQVVTAVALK
ncbi:MAG: phosphodiester glycosidase family protein, partial [Bacteroidales bacterium]|nr:phosphodiester glycosidase family protein [Bacteroidales bacterium]